MVGLAGVTAIEVKVGAGAACTVSVVLPVITVPDNDNFADMVGLPADTPVASPLPWSG